LPGRAARTLAARREIDPDALDLVRGQAFRGELALKIVPMEAVERRFHQNDRAGLEFPLRYVLRPPFALKRMRELPSGKIELAPMALLRRLASIVPPPGSHDTSYFGFLAAHSRRRRRDDRRPC